MLTTSWAFLNYWYDYIIVSFLCGDKHEVYQIGPTERIKKD